MSRNTKIILVIVVGALVVLCLCAGVAAIASTIIIRNASVRVGPERIDINTEPVQINPSEPEMTSDEIVGITLPNGWRSDYSLRVAGFRLVGYKPETGSGHIMLAVLPETPAQSIDEMERELRGLASTHGYKWNYSDMSVVERRKITIKGQETEMVVSESTRSSGAWKQAVTYFRGDQGLTLVVYGMPKEEYNQAEADALFASIR